MLRGLGGTEVAALAGHPAGAAFVILDDAPIALDAAAIAGATQIAAAGLADADPAVAPIANPGATLKPLQPVHPVISWQADGGLLLCWKRRSRGGWQWLDHVDVPLNEEFERYRGALAPPLSRSASGKLPRPCSTSAPPTSPTCRQTTQANRSGCARSAAMPLQTRSCSTPSKAENFPCPIRPASHQPPRASGCPSSFRGKRRRKCQSTKHTRWPTCCFTPASLANWLLRPLLLRQEIAGLSAQGNR